MKTQAIVLNRDLRATQGRVTLKLACGHWVSLMSTDDNLVAALGQTRWNCRACPDISADERQADKSARQLYKEAGEP